MKIKSLIVSLLILASAAFGQSQFGGAAQGPGSAITSVAAGLGLTGGGTTGSLTLNAWMASTNLASGTTVCDRIVSQSLVSNGQSITAENDNTGTNNNCVSSDVQSPTAVNTVNFAGHTGYLTCLGFHVGDRDVFQGENTGKGGTGITANTGTNWNASSSFPTCQAGGGGLTTSGASNTAGNSTLTIALASGGGAVPMQIQPGSTLIIAGDPTQYIVKNCAGSGSAPCSSTVANGAGTSFYYTLTNGTSITINITPNLVTSPGNGTAMLLAPGILAIGEQNTTCNGCSAQDSIWRMGFVNGDSANNSTGNCIGGFAGQAAQENSRFSDVLVRNCAIGFRIFGAPDSGIYQNLNVAYNITVSTCNTPGNGVLTYIPYEFGVGQYSVYRTTAFVDSCTAAEVPFGLYHITDNPLNGVGGGTFTLSDSHGEMCGAWNGTNSCTSGTLAGDMIFDDSTSGTINLRNNTGCPSGFPCLNLIHIASTFAGTLDAEGMSCNTGTTNIIKDDKNGNTLLCSVSKSGDFYRISADGTVFTNVDCVHMTKGFCYNSTGFGYFSGGVLQWRFDGTGTLVAYEALSTTGTGAVVQVANGGATGVTISSNTSIAATSLCSTTQCPAGLYAVESYIFLTATCATTGTYNVAIEYTDSGGTHSTTASFIPYTGVGVTTSTGTLALNGAANYAQGLFILQTTGAANQALGSINYQTTAGACGSGGPAAGKLFLAVHRIG